MFCMCWCVILILGCTAYNLGTGQGTSVLEMVSAFEKASGKVRFSLSLIAHEFCVNETEDLVSENALNHLFCRKSLSSYVQEELEMQQLFMLQLRKLRKNSDGSKSLVLYHFRI